MILPMKTTTAIVHPTRRERQIAKKLRIQPESVWQLENTDEILLFNHLEKDCKGRSCVLHKMTDHSMRHLPQHWRGDRRIMERICTHGIGHPDPDQFEYWKERGVDSSEGVHGCDGCCRQ